TQFKEAAVGLERGGEVKVLLPARLDDSPTEIVGIKQDHHLNAGGGLELPDELGGQLRGLLKREAQGWTMDVFDIQPDAQRDNILTEDQNGAHILVPPNVGVERRVLQLGDRVHGRAPFCLLRIIDDQVDGVSSLRV